MNRSARASLIFVVLSLPTIAGGAQSPGRDTLQTYQRVHLKSRALKGDREIFVSVPNAADALRPLDNLPILILLDAQDTPQFRAALATVRFLSSPDRAAIPPMIVVGIPFGKDRSHDLTPAADATTAKRVPTAGGADATLSFIADEVIPWLDSHYSIGAPRILAGHSFGGLFAVNALASRPSLFRIVIAMSPSLYWNDGHTAQQLAEQLARDSSRARTLFVTSGGREPFIDPATSRFASLVEAALPKNLAFEHRQYAGDTHPFTPLESLIDGLRMAFAPLIVRDDSVFADLGNRGVKDSATIAAAYEALERRYSAAAGSLGVTFPMSERATNLLAYYALSAQCQALSLSLFRRNTDRFPLSSNAHDGLGDGLLAAGDTTAAIGEYRKSASLSRRDDDPGRAAALTSLAELKALGRAGGARP